MTDFDCDAYGPDGRKFNALCFFADPGTRNCATLDECRQSVAAARKVEFQRIQEGAAAGDPDMAYLAQEFASPEQLLGGSEDEGASS